MEGHVVGGAIPVCICDVMDSTYCQDHLSHRVNDGQVNNSPAQREEEEEEAGVHEKDKIDKGQKSKDEI